jgi:hypothetical protein
MVEYKSPENIPFKNNPFKKHPPKLGVSYSVMLGCWFGGDANGPPAGGVRFSCLYVVRRGRDHIWCGKLYDWDMYGVVCVFCVYL